jgi:hypothetical protein
LPPLVQHWDKELKRLRNRHFETLDGDWQRGATLP